MPPTLILNTCSSTSSTTRSGVDAPDVTPAQNDNDDDNDEVNVLWPCFAYTFPVS